MSFVMHSFVELSSSLSTLFVEYLEGCSFWCDTCKVIHCLLFCLRHLLLMIYVSLEEPTLINGYREYHVTEMMTIELYMDTC